MFKRAKGKFGKADSGEDPRPLDAAEDDRIGLTEAFAPVSDGERDGECNGRDELESDVAFDADEKDDAGRDAAFSEPAAALDDSSDLWESLESEEFSEILEPAEFVSSAESMDSATLGVSEGERSQDASSGMEEAESFDFAESLGEMVDAEGASAFADDETEEPYGAVAGQGDEGSQDGRSGKKKKDDLPPYLRKSRRMRRVLIVVIILLLLLIAALGYFTFKLVQESQLLATQQAQEQQGVQEVGALQGDVTEDTQKQAEKTTAAPDLVALLGLTQDEAIEMLQQQGATLLKSSEVASEKPEEGAEAGEGDAAGTEGEEEEEAQEDPSAIASTATIVLTEESGNAKTGTPTVYLGMNKDGAIIQAGYSASTTALGYGASSFSDAVKADHVIEKTLQEAGANVAEGSAQLPEDKAEYATYASDGKTLVKERCAFSGSADIDGASHEWSAVLLYDYSAANASGNLVDTVRIIYVYINA